MGKFEYIQTAFDSSLKPRARLVLQCLVYHADKDGSCFPALKTIATECGYGLSTVKRALRELCDAGYIVKQARFDERKHGGQTSNLYTLAAGTAPACVSDDKEQKMTVEEQKEIPCTEIVPARDKCAHIFTYSFQDGMQRRDISDVSDAFFEWTGGQAILIPP